MSDINEMNVGPRWYVAHTYSGYENKVKASIEKIIENRGLNHLFFDIRIPVETIIEKNGDVEKEVESKIFPCYVYIKMTFTVSSTRLVSIFSDSTSASVRGVGLDPGPTKPVTPVMLRTACQLSSVMVILMYT